MQGRKRGFRIGPRRTQSLEPGKGPRVLEAMTQDELGAKEVCGTEDRFCKMEGQ